ncbi:hypothetical protein GH733_002694, partial [Mirounga leonina]
MPIALGAGCGRENAKPHRRLAYPRNIQGAPKLQELQDLLTLLGKSFIHTEEDLRYFLQKMRKVHLSSDQCHKLMENKDVTLSPPPPYSISAAELKSPCKMCRQRSNIGALQPPNSEHTDVKIKANGKQANVGPQQDQIRIFEVTGGDVGAMTALALRISPLSLSPKNIKALKELPRDRKKQENIKHSRNVSFDKIANIAGQMGHRSLARELSGTIKEILGTAQSVGCSVDGQHLHDIIDDINSGAVEPSW